MTLAKVEGAPTLPRWTGRIALFALVLLLFAIVAHRFFGMSTPLMLSLIKLAFAGAIGAIVLGLVSAVGIWRNGGPGGARILTAFVVAAGMLAWPLAYYPVTKRLPEINDVTTSTGSPPAFQALAAARNSPANGAAYRSDRFAALQLAAYPDLKPLIIDRSSEEVFDLVVEAVRRQKLAIVSETPPGPMNGRVGSIEAVDQTLVMGFKDDVAVRVGGGDSQARVDVRSASRYGRHDLGRNVQRIRALLREIVVRLESTIPGAAENRSSRRRGPEREEKSSVRKGADRKKEAPRR